jgi:hypothetical protein
LLHLYALRTAIPQALATTPPPLGYGPKQITPRRAVEEEKKQKTKKMGGGGGGGGDAIIINSSSERKEGGAVATSPSSSASPPVTTTPLAVHFACGMIAGVAYTVTAHPFDTVKVAMQSAAPGQQRR